MPAVPGPQLFPHLFPHLSLNILIDCLISSEPHGLATETGSCCQQSLQVGGSRLQETQKTKVGSHCLQYNITKHSFINRVDLQVCL